MSYMKRKLQHEYESREDKFEEVIARISEILQEIRDLYSYDDGSPAWSMPEVVFRSSFSELAEELRTKLGEYFNNLDPLDPPLVISCVDPDDNVSGEQ